MAKTEYIWDVVTDNVMMEKDGAGSTQAVYTQEPSQYGRLISQRRGANTSYYHYLCKGQAGSFLRTEVCARCLPYFLAV